MIDLLETVQSSVGQLNALTITATLGVIATTLALWTMVRPRRFPPGPRGLPIVGSIFSMTESPEVIFAEWAKKYGDIFGFKVGERWIVVLNGRKMIKDAVIQQDLDFADRPPFYSVEIFTMGFKDIVASPFTETWKLHRKLAHSALRHFATGKPLQDLISSVYPKVQKELANIGDKPVNPRLLITLLMYNVLSQLCFGKSYELKGSNVLEFMKVNDEVNNELGMGLAADFFTWARYLPTSGPRIMKKFVRRIYTYQQKEVEETKDRFDPDNINDFYSLLLKAQEDAKKEGENVDSLTDTHIFQTLNDIFFAGIQTSGDTLYWALALLSEHQEIQKKVQAEIDQVIGQDRVPTIDDRGSLPYTEATLYEVMRYSSVAPLAIPHSTVRDTEFHGYLIPKGTIVMINTYSMHYDPREWDDPTSFKPEHFLCEDGTVRDHPPSFLPFGAGRRSCLGEAVAKATLFLIFTWFMQRYSFSKVPGKEEESILKVIPKTVSGRVLIPYEIVIKERA